LVKQIIATVTAVYWSVMIQIQLYVMSSRQPTRRSCSISFPALFQREVLRRLSSSALAAHRPPWARGA
jgi:hypothetical protein